MGMSCDSGMRLCHVMVLEWDMTVAWNHRMWRAQQWVTMCDSPVPLLLDCQYFQSQQQKDRLQFHSPPVKTKQQLCMSTTLVYE